MGGGGEKKKTNQMISQDRTSALGEHQNYMGTVNTGLTGATGRASDMYGVQYGGFKDFSEGKFDYGSPDLQGRYDGGGGGGGGGGGYAPAASDPRGQLATDAYKKFLESGGADRTLFDQHQATLVELQKSGGWSPERMASMQGNIDAFKRMGETGGIDAAGQARIRGGGMFEDWAKSGGLSGQDIGNMRARGNSVIPSFYKTMQDESNRMGAIQGGYGPGRQAMAGRMARDQAAGAQRAALDTELGISDTKRKGQMWGGQQMSSSEQGLQELLSRNKLQGLQGATSAETGMVSDIARTRGTSASSAAGGELGMQDLLQKGKMFGTEGLAAQAEAEANRAAQSAAAAASRGDYNRQWEAQFNAGNRLAGLEGMNALYTSKPAEVDMYLGANRSGRDLAYGQQSSTYDARMANNPQRDWVGMTMGLAGAAGGAMTGLGALGFGKKKAV